MMPCTAQAGLVIYNYQELMNLKKNDFYHSFCQHLSAQVVDGIWLDVSVNGGTYTLTESIYRENRQGRLYASVLSSSTYKTWTDVYAEFKCRFKFLLKFYAANKSKRRAVGIGI